MESIITKSTKQLTKEILSYFQQVIDIHVKSKTALHKNDRKMALAVVDMHDEFMDNYVLFKSNVMFTLTKKPLAKNLRSTIGYLLIMKDLESISNFARKIARFIILNNEHLSKSSQQRIRKIHKPVREMMEITLNALKNESKEIIDDVLKKEAQIEKEVIKLRKEIIATVADKKDKELIDERLFMLDVINSQERAGDHLVSICRVILYIKTGNHIMLT